MARYRVQHNYRSNAYGPWVKDDHVELDPEQAAWVNGDSPGTLEEVDQEKQAADKRKAEEHFDAKREQAERIHGVSQTEEAGRMDAGVSQEDEPGREPGGGDAARHQGEPPVPVEAEEGKTTSKRRTTRRSAPNT